MGGMLAVPALAYAHPDLSLFKAVDHAQAVPGDLLTYTIQIQTHGTRASAPGRVTDTLPAHTTFVEFLATEATGVTADARHSVKRYLSSTQSATTPSRQVIFLPSS